MKYFLPTLFVISFLLSLTFFSHIFFTNGLEVSQQIEDKTNSKFYPYEWAYLKKTWPYMNADKRAYIDALEQAHSLQRETSSKRLQKGMDAVYWQFIGPENVGGRVVDIEFNPD